MGESLYENPALQELRRRYNKHKRNYIIKIKEKNKFYWRILRRFFSIEICVCVSNGASITRRNVLLFCVVNITKACTLYNVHRLTYTIHFRYRISEIFSPAVSSSLRPLSTYIIHPHKHKSCNLFAYEKWNKIKRRAKKPPKQTHSYTMGAVYMCTAQCIFIMIMIY